MWKRRQLRKKQISEYNKDIENPNRKSINAVIISTSSKNLPKPNPAATAKSILFNKSKPTIVLPQESGSKTVATLSSNKPLHSKNISNPNQQHSISNNATSTTTCNSISISNTPCTTEISSPCPTSTAQATKDQILKGKQLAGSSAKQRAKRSSEAAQEDKYAAAAALNII